jgi:hypothetical protein
MTLTTTDAAPGAADPILAELWTREPRLRDALGGRQHGPYAGLDAVEGEIHGAGLALLPRDDVAVAVAAAREAGRLRGLAEACAALGISCDPGFELREISAARDRYHQAAALAVRTGQVQASSVLHVLETLDVVREALGVRPGGDVVTAAKRVIRDRVAPPAPRQDAALESIRELCGAEPGQPTLDAVRAALARANEAGAQVALDAEYQLGRTAGLLQASASARLHRDTVADQVPDALRALSDEVAAVRGIVAARADQSLLAATQVALDRAREASSRSVPDDSAYERGQKHALMDVAAWANLGARVGADQVPDALRALADEVRIGRDARLALGRLWGVLAPGEVEPEAPLAAWAALRDRALRALADLEAARGALREAWACLRDDEAPRAQGELCAGLVATATEVLRALDPRPGESAPDSIRRARLGAEAELDAAWAEIDRALWGAGAPPTARPPGLGPVRLVEDAFHVALDLAWRAVPGVARTRPASAEDVGSALVEIGREWALDRVWVAAGLVLPRAAVSAEEVAARARDAVLVGAEPAAQTAWRSALGAVWTAAGFSTSTPEEPAEVARWVRERGASDALSDVSAVLDADAQVGGGCAAALAGIEPRTDLGRRALHLRRTVVGLYASRHQVVASALGALAWCRSVASVLDDERRNELADAAYGRIRTAVIVERALSWTTRCARAHALHEVVGLINADTLPIAGSDLAPVADAVVRAQQRARDRALNDVDGARRADEEADAPASCVCVIDCVRGIVGAESGSDTVPAVRRALRRARREGRLEVLREVGSVLGSQVEIEISSADHVAARVVDAVLRAVVSLCGTTDAVALYPGVADAARSCRAVAIRDVARAADLSQWSSDPARLVEQVRRAGSTTGRDAVRDLLCPVAEVLGWPDVHEQERAPEEIARVVADEARSKITALRERAEALALELARLGRPCPECAHPPEDHGPARRWECGLCSCGHGGHENSYQLVVRVGGSIADPVDALLALQRVWAALLPGEAAPDALSDVADAMVRRALGLRGISDLGNEDEAQDALREVCEAVGGPVAERARAGARMDATQVAAAAVAAGWYRALGEVWDAAGPMGRPCPGNPGDVASEVAGVARRAERAEVLRLASEDHVAPESAEAVARAVKDIGVLRGARRALLVAGAPRADFMGLDALLAEAERLGVATRDGEARVADLWRLAPPVSTGYPIVLRDRRLADLAVPVMGEARVERLERLEVRGTLWEPSPDACSLPADEEALLSRGLDAALASGDAPAVVAVARRVAAVALRPGVHQ